MNQNEIEVPNEADRHQCSKTVAQMVARDGLTTAKAIARLRVQYQTEASTASPHSRHGRWRLAVARVYLTILGEMETAP